jgi:hypothetical protein
MGHLGSMAKAVTISAIALSLAAPSAARPRQGVAQGGAPCTVTGTAGDDDLTGTGGDDVMCGLGGDDRLAPLQGQDVVDGGPGRDVVMYESGAAVVVDIGKGSATGQGADQLVGIEDGQGSPGDDQLFGDGGPNLLLGGDGVDLTFGRDGVDDLRGEAGGDYLHGGEGDDALSGGDGPDACRSGVVTSCFLPGFGDPGGTDGRLDIRRIHSRAANTPPRWRLVADAGWGLRGIWDRGYFLVFADTRGNAEPDYHVLGYSDGERLRGSLYRERPDGSTVRMRGVTVRKKGPRSAILRLPLGAVVLERPYFRWSLMTLFTGGSCRHVCFDRAPDGVQLPQAIGSELG